MASVRPLLETGVRRRGVPPLLDVLSQDRPEEYGVAQAKVHTLPASRRMEVCLLFMSFR